jgi:predicted RNA-binding protein with EMAP domain
MMKRRISLDAVGYIVGSVTSTSRKPPADALAVNWGNNMHGAVFGTVVKRSMDLRRVPNVVKYLIAQSSLEEKLRNGFQPLITYVT